MHRLRSNREQRSSVAHPEHPGQFRRQWVSQPGSQGLGSRSLLRLIQTQLVLVHAVGTIGVDHPDDLSGGRTPNVEREITSTPVDQGQGRVGHTGSWGRSLYRRPARSPGIDDVNDQLRNRGSHVFLIGRDRRSTPGVSGAGRLLQGAIGSPGPFKLSDGKYGQQHQHRRGDSKHDHFAGAGAGSRDDCTFVHQDVLGLPEGAPRARRGCRQPVPYTVNAVNAPDVCSATDRDVAKSVWESSMAYHCGSSMVL